MLFRRLSSRLFISLAALTFVSSARAATLQIAPSSPQPGDVLTVTIFPASGEQLQAVGMSAFDTPNVKFYRRPDGSARGFVGYPFDRSGAPVTLQARVGVSKDGAQAQQIVSARMNARPRRYARQNIVMRNGNEGKMNRRDLIRRENAYVRTKMNDSYGAPLWSGNWLIPCRGRNTSSYGVKRTVNGRPWGQHNGGDLKAPSGTPVQASNAGRVVLSEYLPNLRGNCVVIDHGCNVYSLYMHLSKLRVKVGQNVPRGFVVGDVGATGFVTGPHLHWEVRIGYEPVDPFRVVARGLMF